MPFPSVVLLDSFKRSENPLKKGNGTIENAWKEFKGPCETGRKGLCNGVEYENASAAPFEGAWWSVEEYIRPAVAWQLNKSLAATTSPGFCLYACVKQPESATEWSAYRLSQELESGEQYKINLHRIDKSVATELTKFTLVKVAVGDKVGLLIQSGQVQAWHKVGAGEWAEIGHAEDSTYTQGYVAMTVKGNNGSHVNFEASGLVQPTLVKPPNQHSIAGHSASLQVSGLHVEEYKATGLPEGLSINSVTGLITGAPTKVESPTVTIKGKGEAEPEAETTFEWVVEKFTLDSKPGPVILPQMLGFG